MGHFIIKDETLFGEVLQEHRLEIPQTTITLRDIISARVGEEVRRRNARTNEHFRFLIDVSQEESRLNKALKSVVGTKPIAPAKPIAKALEAFEANAFFVLVGDRQVESLDEVIVAERELDVSFVKLTPLIGG